MADAVEKRGMCANNLVLQKVGKGEDDSRFRIWPSLERVRYYGAVNDADKALPGLEVLVQAHFAMDGDMMPVEYVKKDYTHDFKGVKTTTS